MAKGEIQTHRREFPKPADLIPLAPFSSPEAVSQVQRAAISAIPTFVFGRFHQ